jgi:hypothetical protein
MAGHAASQGGSMRIDRRSFFIGSASIAAAVGSTSFGFAQTTLGLDAARRFRPGPPIGQQSTDLGLLAGLTGRWTGKGFNLISLPDFDSNPPSTGPKPFRLLMNATLETLEFIPIGADVPNRGSELASDPTKGQDDILIYGLRYLQRISDLNALQPLHLEPGFWLNVPASTVPQQAASIVRQGSIPHGSSVLIQGTAFMSPTGKPVFAAIDSTPQRNPPSTPLGDAYLAPFTTEPLPAPFMDRAVIKNPNLILADAVQNFMNFITETVVLNISTKTAGGVINIPFLQNTTNNNAAATSVEATFWIEHVEPKDATGRPVGRPFDVLQYTQTVILNFLGIDWPHITVSTMFRQ